MCEGSKNRYLICGYNRPTESSRMAPEMQSVPTVRKRLYSTSTSQSGWYLPACYFLRLFFWFAAIFSLAVSGVAFAGVTFPSVPAGSVPGRFSTFRPLPFLFPSSLMREYLRAGRINSLLPEICASMQRLQGSPRRPSEPVRENSWHPGTRLVGCI